MFHFLTHLTSYYRVYCIVIFCFPLVLASASTKCQALLPFLVVKNFIGTFNNQCLKMKSLSEWCYTQPSLLAQFPIDPIEENYVRKVPGVVFSPAVPTPLKTDLQLVSASQDVLVNIMDLDPAEANNPAFAKFIAGNQLLPGSKPLAHRYGGHQFGYWADQLGDGRAIMIGEYINK